MTNREKIKAYLDAGHKVKIELDDFWMIIYFENQYYYIGTSSHNDDHDFYFIAKELVDKFDYNISINQEPLRYPKAGSYVIDIRNGKKYMVVECLNTHCIVDGVPIAIDYRHLAPYLE